MKIHIFKGSDLTASTNIDAYRINIIINNKTYLIAENKNSGALQIHSLSELVIRPQASNMILLENSADDLG